ncbi:hypothetical protein B0A49_07713 [Cryomyces minteri]|uniref:Methyltransferase type 12 domain-containing protein n=1 Tax=Cryomyces minteri TaxID=331657 RepID=A0A4U0XBP4_9PEZI|nr:hypothetical protein B0A49_07713 [Cryomyces minteri]
MSSGNAPRSKGTRQQLTKGMEHMRSVVTVPVDANTTTDSDESNAYGVPSTFAPIRKPAQRPQNELKRTDPFQFGSRYLEEGDDIFEFNAWDHVEVSAEYQDFALTQYEKQRADPVSDFDKRKYNEDPAKWWNKFYGTNNANFFKNRKWLQQEFPILGEITKEDSKPCVLLEVGAGAGNTAFPILAMNKNPGLKIHACDFSKKAVELIRSNEAYDETYIQADVWDVAATGEASLPPGVTPESVDVVLMIFIFSALSPAQWDQAVRNIRTVLKPGGEVLFRDYGRGDLAQVRFKKGRWMEDNFYVRGDGTRVYFFEKEELEAIWGGGARQATDCSAKGSASPSTELEENGAAQVHEEQGTNGVTNTDGEPNGEPNGHSEPEGAALEDLSVSGRDGHDSADASETPNFEIIDIGVDRRMLVNRQRKLKMYRCWMQAKFRKPLDGRATAI